MSASASSIREIFEAAAALPDAERAAYLQQVCPDPDRRRRIERMLAAIATDEDGLLDRSLEDVATRLGAPAPAMDAHDWIGQCMGPFRLVELLGEGGTSLVYRGERVQGDVMQRVAVKVFRRILVGTAEHRRFRRERSALAQLSHPDIARYLDGGVTPAGIAYIVMELVEGRRITDYLRETALGVEQRVALMIAVCRAVDAAHRAFIVHRDLKPSNVLVTAAGQVKLLDFGIAKFLDNTEDATETGNGALTPAYAAPEQFSGAPITAATDVYALGVLLAEVLTGQRYTVQSSGLPSALPGDDAPRVGLLQPPALLRPQLRGDLDNIVLKAVAAQPTARYASAEALADDLGRYLHKLPVLAHPPSRRYRLRKFVTRHRGSVAAGTVALLGIVIGLGAAWHQARSAQQQALRAQATRDFLVEVFRSAEPAGPAAGPVTVVEVTQAAVRRARAAQDLLPVVRQDLLTQLGAVLRGQGEFAEAIAVLDSAAAPAAGSDANAVLRARLELVQALIEAGQLERAAATVDIDAGTLAAAPRDLRVWRESLDAQLQGKLRRSEEAARAARRAVTLCESGCDDETRILAYETLGDIAGTFGGNTEAAAAYAQALALARVRYGSVHVRTATILNGLSGAYRRLGRLDEAAAAAEEVARIDDATLPALHWRRSYHLNYRGNLQASQGDTRGAIASYARAVEIARATFGADAPELSADLTSLGVLHSRLGEHERAVAYFAEALTLQERSQAASPPSLAFLRCNLGHGQVLAGELASGRALCAQAADALRGLGDGARVQLIGVLGKSGWHALWANDAAQAAARFDEALQLVEALGAEWPALERPPLEIGRGVARLQAGEVAAGIDAIAAALATLEQADAAHRAQLDANLALALQALAQRDGRGARARLQRAHELMRRVPAPNRYQRLALEKLEADPLLR